jgi:hypothetical protein
MHVIIVCKPQTLEYIIVHETLDVWMYNISYEILDVSDIGCEDNKKLVYNESLVSHLGPGLTHRACTQRKQRLKTQTLCSCRISNHARTSKLEPNWISNAQSHVAQAKSPLSGPLSVHFYSPGATFSFSPDTLLRHKVH